MNGNPVCWSRAAIDFATQIDVGSLEVDDPRADMLFDAIHQSLPVGAEVNNQIVEVSENEVLNSFTRPITSNEPLLLFIKGETGTGKSHLVRWLKSQLGARPNWHIVYIEKRNTSLRRVTERILDGINTPKAKDLRKALAEASSALNSEAEAMNALVARLDQLVTFDPAPEVPELRDLSAAEIANLRREAHRLLGDFTFRKELCKAGGPIRRIVDIAMPGEHPSENVNEAELHLTEVDFVVDVSVFEELGPELFGLVKRLSNRGHRADIAALCDSYLSRAKAEVFMGQRTDLLEVFEEVREEIKSRGKELCLLIEDLVLLHGIDRQLAQALTIPATSKLCKLRAAIAVTSGYLNSVATFTNRGLLYTLDMRRDAIDQASLRDFVARYLNAGRSKDLLLATSDSNDGRSRVTNWCSACPVRIDCHATFGKSQDGYGFYPFNGEAIDRLINLASPDSFQPRTVLRQVIRSPLEVAEIELPTKGRFPSDQFARSLDDVRQSVPPGVRAAIHRINTVDPDAEVSLRAFYAEAPPATDLALKNIANYIGVQLTTGVSDDQIPPDEGKVSQSDKRAVRDEIDRWANGTDLLTSPTANRIRRWICNAVIAHLQSGPYGLSIVKTKSRGTVTEWQIGSHQLRTTDVAIRRAHGGGAVESDHPFEILPTDESTFLIRGILASIDGNSLDSEDQGRWFFRLQTWIRDYAALIADLAEPPTAEVLSDAVQAIEIMRYMSVDPGRSVADALRAMLMPNLPPQLNPVIKEFARDVRSIRDDALTIVRDHATTAKGTGSPSLLDVGAMQKQIQSHLSKRYIAEQLRDDVGGELLRRLQIAQSRAARRMWSAVSSPMQDVSKVIDPSEDLATTFKMVDRLVKEAGLHGRLERGDSEEAYNVARRAVNTEAMNTYRRLSKKTPEEFGPGDLWDVVDDPMPNLNALRDYAAVTEGLLKWLNGSLQVESVDSDVNIEALIGEFRTLAELLDQAGRITQ